MRKHMRKQWYRRERGQAIVMVALSLVAMCGVLGLAVDLSWSFFVRRNAQRAADAGALAAALQFATKAGLQKAYTSCPAGSCQSDYVCASSITVVQNTVDSGCIYIRGGLPISPNYWYGFIDGTNSGRAQGARLDSGLGNVTVFNAANPAGVQIKAGYWVTARVWEDIPQLFSAVLGNSTGRVAARASAAVVVNTASTRSGSKRSSGLLPRCSTVTRAPARTARWANSKAM